MRRSMAKRDVEAVFRDGRIFSLSGFTVRWRQSGLSQSRIAFAFARGCGNAVKRNRFKRRFRALVQRIPGGCGVDFVVSAKTALAKIADATWQGQADRFVELCEKLSQSLRPASHPLL